MRANTTNLTKRSLISTRLQDFGFSTPSRWQGASPVPFSQSCVFCSSSDSEGRAAFTESPAPFPWASCVSPGSIPSRQHRPGPTLLKLARSDEIIARKRWQRRSVRDSKRTHYEPGCSPPRWESGVTMVKPRVQTVQPTRRAQPDLSMPLRHWAKPPLFQPRMKWHSHRNQRHLPELSARMTTE